MNNKILIFGVDSFTGKHLTKYLRSENFDIYGTSFTKESKKIYLCDISKKESVLLLLKKIKPNYIINLSGISFPAHENIEDFYKVNTIAALNILDAALELNLEVKKIILVSSAAVYGNQDISVLDETLCPKPSNHYGASKYSMENLSRNYFSKLNIIILRPFNYTGIDQEEHFLIPKIVSHYKNNLKTIELGNINVSREFNDIYFVCEVYKRFLQNDTISQIVNIASNRGIKLLDVISMMNVIAKYDINISINQKFVRKNEIKSLTGCNRKLFSLLGEIKQRDFKDTLGEMFEA